MAEHKQTYIEVEHLRTEHIVVDNLDIESRDILGNNVEELRELGTTNTIGAVNGQRALDLLAPQSTDKGLGHLLVVSSLANFSICLGCSFCVDASDEVVELRGREDLEVGLFGAGSNETVGEGRDEAVSRRTGIAAVDNTARSIDIDLELRSQVLVGVEELLVCLAVDKLGRVCLPLLLEHFAHGVDNFDTIVGSRVVRSCDHDTNGLAVELSAAETSQQANSKGDGGEQVGLHAKASRSVLVGMARHNGVLGRSGDDFVVHGRAAETNRGVEGIMD